MNPKAWVGGEGVQFEAWKKASIKLFFCFGNARLQSARLCDKIIGYHAEELNGEERKE